MRPLSPPAPAVDCTSLSLPVSLNLTRSRRQTTQNGDFHACRHKTAGFLLYPSVWAAHNPIALYVKFLSVQNPRKEAYLLKVPLAEADHANKRAGSFLHPFLPCVHCHILFATIPRQGSLPFPPLFDASAPNRH